MHFSRVYEDLHTYHVLFPIFYLITVSDVTKKRFLISIVSNTM